MRVAITPPNSQTNGTATPFLLGDDSIAALTGPTANFLNGAGGLIGDGFIPSLSQATQRDELINSDYAQELPRGNAQTTWTFKVSRTFDTPDNALMFLADHPALCPIVGEIAVFIGNTARYLQNAVLKDIRCDEHTNLSVVFSYTYSGSYNAPVAGAAGSGTGGAWQTTP